MTFLIIATALVGLVLVAKGSWMIAGGTVQIARNRELLYNRPLGIAVWLVAVAWVLWETLKLGPSDFGDFKILLFSLFSALGLLSIWFLKDYLVVRAGCILALMLSWWLLKAAYFQAPWTRLFLVAFSYAWIVGALYLSVAPWRARDVFDYLTASPRRPTIVGGLVTAYGIILLIAAATYPWIR